jgi:hypothetical protein
MFGFGSGLGGIAKGAADNASSTAAGYGSQAAGINANLLPFLTRELQNPEGYTQQQTGSMLGAAEGGAGGATAGLNTEANLTMARNRNSGGFSGALDAAAREKDKALAGASEGIAANNAQLQEQQKQSAASGLQSMQGMDTNAQLKAMGLIPEDIKAGVEANNAPWEALGGFIKNMGGLQGIGSFAGKLGVPGFSGFNQGQQGQG